MERATKFLNVDKKITPPSAFSLSCLLTCCQTPENEGLVQFGNATEFYGVFGLHVFQGHQELVPHMKRAIVRYTQSLG